jgi:tetratricopeptide (TPR) repeat protein
MRGKTASPFSQPIQSAFELFQKAIFCHQHGRLSEAEQYYQLVLKTDARHFPSVHSLGLIRLQQARHADAISLFQQAIKINNNSAEAHHHLAVALTGLGRLSEAVRGFEKALAINPNFAEAHDSLGHALQMVGRVEEAIAHHEKALAIKPSYATARNNLGNALQKLSRFEEAVAQYEKALVLRPVYPEAHNNFGLVLAKVGRHEEAIAQYRKALASNPNYVHAHVNLAKQFTALARNYEAIDHYRKALALDPSDIDVLDRLGRALLACGQSEEAIAHFERALAIRPDSAEIYNSFGGALQVIGRLEEAVHAFETAIARAPHRSAGYYNLAGAVRLAADDPRLTAMEVLARDIDALEVDDQIHLRFGLGKVFANLGDHERSFQHVLEGNRLKRQQITYDETKMLAGFDRIRATFTAELIREKQKLGDPSRTPVFVVGMPRSGTTLIEQILSSHPKAFGAGELRDFGALARNLRGPGGSEFPECVEKLTSDQIRAIGTSYMCTTRPLAPTAERIVDKMPYNFHNVGLIRLALPNALIIHARRDPRDIALSCFSLLFTEGNEFTYDLGELGRYIRSYQTLMQHWHRLLPQGAILEVQYEELVKRLDEEARRIVAHCGLDWDDACLAFYKTQRPVRTASVNQVRQPIYTSSVGRWRRYEEFLQPLLAELTGSSTSV